MILEKFQKKIEELSNKGRFRFQIVSEVKLPEQDGVCEHCDRKIKYIVSVLDRSNMKKINLGKGCVKHYCGKTVKQIKKINEEEENKERTQRGYGANRDNFVISYQEIGKDVLSFIDKNKDKDEFLKSCLEAIEKNGKLSDSQLHWVIIKMNNRTKIEGKVKDMKVSVFHFQYTNNDFGGFATLWAFDENHDLVKLHFSSFNTHGEVLSDLGVIEHDDWHNMGYNGKATYTNQVKLVLDGTIKNGKITRIKNIRRGA